MSSIAQSLAIRSLKLQSIGISSEGFKWASGFLMAAYNDNRLLLHKYCDRMLVAQGFVDTIKSREIEPDFIFGTSSAGVAPAASVAQLMGLPLVIEVGEKGHEELREFNFTSGGIFVPNNDIIAATFPYSVPFGVFAANEQQRDFIYLREAPKGHGLMKQVEGIPKVNDRSRTATLLDCTYGDPRFSEEDRLREMGGAVTREGGYHISDHIITDVGTLVTRPNVEGKVGVTIEDLFSMGGSAAQPTMRMIDRGADMRLCASIYTWGFSDVATSFEGITDHTSLLGAETMIGVMKDTGYLYDTDEKTFYEWRKDPKGWRGKVE